MISRLRPILAVVAVLVAAFTALISVTAPAHAVRAVTCAAPLIEGSVLPTTTSESDHALQLQATGQVPARCTAHRWILTLQSQSTGAISRVNDSRFTPRGSTISYLGFPSATFAAPPGEGLMSLRVQAQVKFATNLWFPLGSQTYYLEVPTAAFSTATLGGAPSTATCGTGGPSDPIIGQRAWC